MLDSSGGKVQDIEIDQNILSPQAAELELAPFGAVKLEVRGLVPYLDGSGETGSNQSKDN